jgi:hypothetical protein
VVRYTNLPIAGILALHFGIVSLLMFLKGHRREAIIEAIPFCLGIAISAAVLLTYDAQVFGSPFDYGYKHSALPAKFAWDYIGQPGVILEIIKGNLLNTPMPLLIGFPLLVIAIPGMLYIFEEKVSHWLRQSKAKLSKEHNTPWQELPWPVLLILIGWFLSVYVYYFLYEWTSKPLMAHLSYMAVARFYVPGLFPLVIISSLLLAKVPPKLALNVLLICFIIGSILFVKAVS